MTEDKIMIEHTHTKTWIWMGRKETICTECFEVLSHEDKPMRWTNQKTGKVEAEFND